MFFEQNIPWGTRVMNIFIQRAQSARMMLDEASSPFCIPVAYKSIQKQKKAKNKNKKIIMIIQKKKKRKTEKNKI